MAIVSKSITDIIKQAVSETIKDCENNTQDESSVILLDLAGRKQDFQDVGTLLKEIIVNSMSAACIRIGRKTGNARPLKLVLNSVANKDTVLRAAKHLKGSKTFTRIRVVRILTKDELVKDKAIRNSAKKPNEDAEATD